MIMLSVSFLLGLIFCLLFGIPYIDFLKNILFSFAPSIFAASYTWLFIVEKPESRIIILYPTNFHTDTIIRTVIAKSTSYNHSKFVLNKWLISPILGSKIHCHIIAITIIGVTNGIKYVVLKISFPLIFWFKKLARTKGRIVAKIVTIVAYKIVFFNISQNSFDENKSK